MSRRAASLLLRDPDAMIAQPYQLYIERTGATRNMAGYHAMSIEPTLFGQACTIRRGGRIGAGAQRLVHYFQRKEEAVELFLTLLRQERSRGYGLKRHAGHKAIA